MHTEQIVVSSSLVALFGLHGPLYAQISKTSWIVYPREVLWPPQDPRRMLEAVLHYQWGSGTPSCGYARPWASYRHHHQTVQPVFS